MTKGEKKERSDILYETILTLKDLDECKKFFSDLCTVAELRAMEQRFEVAILLSNGMIYNDILERTGASSAIISRVNRVLSARDSVLRQFVEESRPGPDDAAYVETYQGRQNDS